MCSAFNARNSILEQNAVIKHKKRNYGQEQKLRLSAYFTFFSDDGEQRRILVDLSEVFG